MEKSKSLLSMRFRRDWLFKSVGVWYYGGMCEDGVVRGFRTWSETPDSRRYLP